jgi:peptide-methionine (S)-S-oxide reductase
MNEESKEIQPPSIDVAVLGGGCFWCLEAVFSELRGVIRVLPGYAGGTAVNPTYKQVCTGDTGHAEVVKITFDPQVIRFRDLLTIFFHTHDPTTPDRQGPDEGTQYRSIVLYRGEEQKKATEEVIAELEDSKLWGGAKFVTQLKSFEVFYEAEVAHQEYFKLHPEKPYCQSVISPKVIKLHKLFSERTRKSGGAK